MVPGNTRASQYRYLVEYVPPRPSLIATLVTSFCGAVFGIPGWLDDGMIACGTCGAGRYVTVTVPPRPLFTVVSRSGEGPFTRSTVTLPPRRFPMSILPSPLKSPSRTQFKVAQTFGTVQRLWTKPFPVDRLT